MKRSALSRGPASRKLRLAVLGVTVLALILVGWLILRSREGALKNLRARGEWRIGMDPSFPPFENLDASSGQVVGLDVDLAQALGRELQIRTEIVSLGFDELIDAVAAHRVDAAISALPIIPERTQDVRFSDPYVQAGVLLAARKDGAIHSTADLAGRRVAVEWGSQGDAEARRLLAGDDGKSGLRFELLPKDTVTAALDALVAGEADASIADAVSLALYPQTDQLRPVGEPLLSDPYVVVVSHDAPDLLRAVNEALHRLESSGALDQLRERWLRPR